MLMTYLRDFVYRANMMLVENGLITLTWGNVSGIDRERGYIVIKPSGVEYDKLSPEKMVVVDLDGNLAEGSYKPSSDTSTHVELYKKFKGIGGIVHTHSPMATAWAQAGRDIPAYGTTHADYFYGKIPVTRLMTDDEIKGNYEKETGKVIAERFEGMNPMEMPAVLVNSHGPFTWGDSALSAVENAIVLENVAALAHNTEQIFAKSNTNDNLVEMQKTLMDRHYFRKHGENAYYGQR